MIAVREAAPADEPTLLRLAAVPMPGWVRLRYDYGAGYAAAEALKGDRVKILVVESPEKGILGCTTRAVRECWLDGRPVRIGYQSGTRSFPEARKGFGFFRGLVRVRELTDADPCALDFTTVLDDNAEALALFTSGRAGLPKFADAGRILTWTVAGRGVAECGPTDWSELQSFYNREAPRRPMFPVFGPSVRERFSPDDFVTVRRDGRLVAAAAVWRHGATRRIFVDGYASRLFAFARPVVNFGVRLAGRPALPPAGGEFACAYLAFVLVENDDSALFAELVRVAAAKAGPANLVLSLHERDSLVATMKRFPAWTYASRLLTYSFAGEPRPFDGIPHIEAGAL